MAGSGTDLDPGIGTGQERNLDWNWTGESDRSDRTRRGSGSWNYCFWVGSIWSDSSWIRELDRNWTGRLWQERKLDFLHRSGLRVGWHTADPRRTETLTWNRIVFTGTGLRGGWHTADPWRTEILTWNQIVFTGTGLRGGWHTADPRRTEILTWNRLAGTRNLSAWLDPGTCPLGWILELVRNRNWTGTVKVERSRTILRAAGVVHQLTQASTRMGTFLGVSSTGGHSGTG